MKFHSLLVLLVLLALVSVGRTQGTALLYQGRLNGSAGPANGVFDFNFTVYDALADGNSVAGPLTKAATPVTNGLFTLTLDFGAGVFTGPDRWLELAVDAGLGDGFVTLTPRQPLAAVPYSIYSGNSAHADLAAQSDLANSVLGGVISASQLNTLAEPASGQVLGYNGTQLVWQAPVIGGASGGWSLTGNLGTTAGLYYLGTADNQPLEFKVNGSRALRLEYGFDPGGGSTAPNLIGGAAANFVSSSVNGALVAGGGHPRYPNQVAGDYASVLGGIGNTASGYSSVAMGNTSVARGDFSTAIGFGAVANGYAATALGYSNTASG